MNWTEIILTLGLVCYMTYAMFSCLLIGGLPISLSETYYKLKGTRKQWLFVATLLLTAVTLMPLWLEITSGRWYQFLVFFACVGVIFVAFTPNYKDSPEKWVHFSGAVVACISVALYHIFNGTLPILLICLIPSFISLIFYRKSISFFVENSIVCSVYLSLI